MANTTRLGENQLHVMKVLTESRWSGYWTPGCGWIWNTYTQTIRIMEGLRRRGLVKNVGEPAGSRKERYELTPEGESFVATLHTPKVSEGDRRIVVVMMAEHDLDWDPTCGWHFKNTVFTELAMKDLEREGLVQCVDRRKKMYTAGAKLLDLAYEYGYDPNLNDGV